MKMINFFLNIMNDLPEEVILHIFRFVSDEDLIKSISLVCRQFCKISKDNSLWVPRWKNWRHNGGQAFLEHSYYNYIYMMKSWQEWLRNLKGSIQSITLSHVVIGENKTYFPFYIPIKWVESKNELFPSN